jgi:hypothetical protein
LTQRPAFVDGLQVVINDENTSNEERAAAVEEYILQ